MIANDVLMDAIDTFVAAAARDGVVDNLELTDGATLAFARRHGGSDAVDVLIRGFARSAGSWGTLGSRVREALKVPLADPCRTTRRPPPAVLLLIALCIVQYDLSRSGEEKQVIRDAFEKRVGVQVAYLNALPSLWFALQTFLRASGIELILPEDVPASRKHVAYHRFLVFPAAPDRIALRRAIFDMHSERRRSDAWLAHLLRELPEREEAWRHHHGQWHDRWIAGNPSHRDMLFWRLAIEERDVIDRRARVVIAAADVHPYGLWACVENDGNRIPLDPIAPNGLDRTVAGHLRRGFLPMRLERAGTYVDVSDGRTPDSVLARSEIARRHGRDGPEWHEVDEGAWVVGPCPPDVLGSKERPQEHAAPTWRGGIRVGRGYLHRGTFAPTFLSGPEPPIATQGESAVGMQEIFPGGWRADRSVEGELLISWSDRTPFRMRARSRARPHYPGRLATYSVGDGLHEDGELRGTAPLAPTVTERPRAAACTTRRDLLDLGEALYARSARGIALGEAVALAGEISTSESPTPWDMVRSFVDAGWYDWTWVPGVAAQRLRPRPTILRLAGDHLHLDGIVCEEDVERLQERAKAIGATVAVRTSGEWSVPVVSVCGGDDAQVRLAEEVRLPFDQLENFVPPPPVKSLRRLWNADSYDQGRYDFGPVRFDRADGKGPPVWRHATNSDRVHGSRTCAMLDASEVDGRPAFVWRDGTLLRQRSGTNLPASWARWLRMRTNLGAGPRRSGVEWTYAYPCDRLAALALADITNAIEPGGRSPVWIDRSRRPRGRGRLVVAAGAIECVHG